MTPENKPSRRSALSFIGGELWCITREGLELVINVASRDELFTEVRIRALEARNGQPLKNAPRATVRDGVAVIPVVGPLVRHADLFSDISGATSYAAIRRDLQEALDAPGVRAILLNIDSPGGEANGVAELADAIAAARGRKPIAAYVGGMGASAAYWLASATDEIVASKTAQLGSIGVRATLVDDRKAMEAAGLREVEFVSSQSPHKANDYDSDEARARHQRRIDDMADVFVDSVARNRGVSGATVIENFGRGDVLVGQRAVDAGLADRLGDFESTLAKLASPGAPTSSPTSSPAASAAPARQAAVSPGDRAAQAYIDARTQSGSTPRPEVIAELRAGRTPAPPIEDRISEAFARERQRLAGSAAEAPAITTTTPGEKTMAQQPKTLPDGTPEPASQPGRVADVIAARRDFLGVPGGTAAEENARAQALQRLLDEEERAGRPLPTTPEEWRLAESIAQTRMVNGRATAVDVAFLATTKAQREAATLAKLEEAIADAKRIGTPTPGRRVTGELLPTRKP